MVFSEPETNDIAMASTVEDNVEEVSTITPTDGQGDILENSTKDASEREFYTIETKNGNIFYIVADKEKNSQNVYLLNEVDERDLAGFLDEDAENEEVEQEDSFAPEPSPAPEEADSIEESEVKEEQEEIKPEKKSKTGTYLIMLLLVGAAAGAYYYLKIYKPKHDLKGADDWEDVSVQFDGESEEDMEEYDEEYDQE